MKSKILYAICLSYVVDGFGTYNLNISKKDLIEADPSLTAIVNLFTIHQVSLLFIAIPTISIVFGLFKKISVAYGVMTFLVYFWSMLYLLALVQTGYWESLYGFFSNIFFAAVLTMCSKIVEMPPDMIDHGELVSTFGDIHLRGDKE